jgi:hypothetical protein
MCTIIHSRTSARLGADHLNLLSTVGGALPRVLVRAAAAVTIAVLTAPASAQVCQGLVGHWSFDGGSFVDRSGTGNNATNIGGVLVQGASVDAMRFSNAAASYAQIENAASLNPTSAITLAAWVRNPSGRTGNDSIIDKGATSHSPPFYQYHLGYGGGFSFDLAIGGARRTVTGGGANGLWQFVAATYDGSAMRLFIDGVQVNSLTVSGSITSYARPLRLGRFSNVAVSSDVEVDEVRIYNRALSGAEILALLRSPSGAPVVTPGAIDGCLGSPATLTVQPIGSGTPTDYQWFRDGIAVDPLANPSASTPSLTTPALTAADAGSYHCVVTTSCGTFMSLPALLTIAVRCSVADVVGTVSGAASCGDGTVDGSDFIAFINSFSTGDPAVDPLADLAGGGDDGLEPDGTIDGTDFITFINAFAIGC